MNKGDGQKQPNREHIEGSNDSKLPNIEPGKQDGAGTIQKNPNPRANENLNNASASSKSKGKGDSVLGTEITDGEDG
jgi:hypothetical protein